ncbi:TPA: hypothetical protein P6N04_003673 [Pseudomonas aeruginosa]|nr:hypothetical protein [Pseudomonas aeruginosa]HDP3824533.1 hypothetical protein [Pseudomonas aeruginosa]HDP3959564.1 hypothetical protein [Pseudomonas aeruginosa]
MSEVERFNEYTWGVTEDEHGEYVRYADYDALAAEAQALRQEVAALRARVAVVPDGYALVPVEPTREMFIAINKEDDKAYAGGCHHGAQFEWLWDAAIEAAPRPNSLTVSEGLLRRIVTPALTSSDAHDRIGALEELRALLSEQDGGKP